MVDMDSMLATVANGRWLRLHREMMGLQKSCWQSQVAGKNVKPMLRQKNRSNIELQRKQSGNGNRFCSPFA